MTEKEKMTLRQIKASGELVLYTDKMEGNDGTVREFLILAQKKQADFMKDEKGRNMYNVNYETREWIPKEQLKNLVELFK